MKLRIARTMLVAAAALAFGSAAYAQEVNVRGKVPFAFVLDDKLYPAGEYAVQTVMADSVYVRSEYLKNETKPEPALTLSKRCHSFEPAKKTVLIFHRVGNTYFLYQVWVVGSEVGREFPRCKTEIRMAMNGTKAETVTVAANITR